MSVSLLWLQSCGFNWTMDSAWPAGAGPRGHDAGSGGCGRRRDRVFPNEINKTIIGLGAIRDMVTDMIVIMVSASGRCSSDSCTRSSNSSFSAWVGPSIHNTTHIAHFGNSLLRSNAYPSIIILE